MRKRALPALALAALLLTACGSSTRHSSSLLTYDTETPETAPLTTAGESDALPTAQPQEAAQWVVEPAIEADNIDVLRLGRGNGNLEDYNAFALHKDDGLCVITQGGKYGLIDYSGNLVVPAEYDTIQLGMNGIYILSQGGGEYNGGASWTLDGNNSLVSLSGVSMVDTVGSAPNRDLYWVPERGSLYISGGADTWLEASYTGTVPCAGWVVTAIEYDCATAWDGYVLTDGTRPVSDTRYEAAGAYSCGLIPMKLDGLWGYLDAQGSIVLPFEYEGGWAESTQDVLANNGTEALPYAASYGGVVVNKGDQYALYDTAGNCVIDFGSYEALRPLHGDKLWAKQGGKWGVLQLSQPLGTSQTGYATPGTGVTVAPDVLESSTVVCDADGGLVLRAGPGADYERLGSIPKGTAVQVLGRSSTADGWLYVEYGGWISAEYVLPR